jgi:hypothetical protein
MDQGEKKKIHREKCTPKTWTKIFGLGIEDFRVHGEGWGETWVKAISKIVAWVVATLRSWGGGGGHSGGQRGSPQGNGSRGSPR